MDIWTVLKACARRWYVFVPLLALTVGFGYSQMRSTPPTYLATSTATLTGPALVPGDEPGEVIELNPFESLGGSLNATTKVLVALMDASDKRDQFYEQGVTADYEVFQDEAVVYFDVAGGDPDEVVASAARLVELLDVELANLQGRAVEAPESRVRAVAVALPSSAVEDPVGGIRVFAVIAALGLAVAVAAALVTDAVAQGRRRRAGLTAADRSVGPAHARPAERGGHRAHDAGEATAVDANENGSATADHDGTAVPDEVVPTASNETGAEDTDPFAPVPAGAGRNGTPDRADTVPVGPLHNGAVTAGPATRGPEPAPLGPGADA